LAIFLKFYIRPPVSDFMFFKMYFMLDGLILFRKVIFIPKYVSRMVFKGGILGGVHQFWGNKTVLLFRPYCLITIAVKSVTATYYFIIKVTSIILSLSNNITLLHNNSTL